MKKLFFALVLLGALAFAGCVSANPPSSGQVVGPITGSQDAAGDILPQATTPGFLPDLVSDLLPDNASGMVGSNVDLLVKTSNIGMATAGTSTTRVLADGKRLKDFGIPKLSPGASKFNALKYYCATEGLHSLNSFADYFNRVRESNENNNRDSLVVNCVTTNNTNKPDLISRFLNTSNGTVYGIVGQNVSATERTSNVGNALAGSSTTRVTGPSTFYFAKPSLSPGQYRDDSFSYYCDSEGAFYFDTLADYDNRVAESNENNNADNLTIVCSPAGQSGFQMKTYVSDHLDNLAYNVRSVATSLLTTFSASSPFNVTVSGNPDVITEDDTSILELPNGGFVNYQGSSTTQHQKIYVSSKTAYDASDNRLEGQNARPAYEVNFNTPIPLCLDTTKSQADCAVSDLMVRNHVKVNFLGSEWGLMPNPFNPDGRLSVSNTTAGYVMEVQLENEFDYKSQMRVNDFATFADGFKVTLSELQNGSYGTRATFRIYDSLGVLVDQISLYAAENYFRNGHGILVWNAQNQTNQYAEVSFFTGLLEFDDGQKIRNHGDWVSEIQSKNVGNSEGIEKIVLIDTTTVYNLAAGESIQMIANAPGFSFAFDGLDLGSNDYDNLAFVVQKNATLSTGSGITLSGDFLQVSSLISNAFQPAYYYAVSQFYVLLNPQSTTSDGRNSYASATVFFSLNSTGFYATPGNSTQYSLGNNLMRVSNVLYHTPDGLSTNAYLAFAKVVRSNSSTLSSDAFIVAIPEQTEDQSSVARVGLNQTGQPYWTLLYDTRLRQFVSSMGSSAIGANPFGYEANDTLNTGSAMGDPLFGIFPGSGFNQPVSFANAEAEYISFRASKAVSFGAQSVLINYAKKVGHGIYSLVRAS